MTYEQDVIDRPIAKEQTAEHKARANVYRLFAALLATPPNDELIQIVRNIDVPEATDDKSLTEAWQQLKNVAQQVTPDEIEEEYFNLFIGLGKGETSPYASWYLTGFLMEKPLAELRSELLRLGFDRQANVSEPEDHVAAICEVMSVIISDSELSFNEEKPFFTKFIEPWMGRFFDDLTRTRSANFYKPVGILGKQFIDIEQRYFSMPV